MKRLSPVLLAALLAAGAASASAEIALEGVHWQVGRVEAGRVAAWQDVKVLADAPPKLVSRVRARLVLRNRGAAAEETLLIRYSMTARVAPAKDAAAEGAWAIPFAVEERRVAKIGAGKMIEVPLDTGAALDLYARRLARAGFWPDRVKLQVMLEPRAGESALQIVEDVLEVQRDKP